jgi:serine protease Do
MPRRLLPTFFALIALLGWTPLAVGDATTRPAAVPDEVEEAVEDEAVLGGGKTFPQDTPERVLDVTESVFPAVVALDVAQEIYRDGKRTLQRGTGSGVIFNADGYVLTNYHVAGRAAEIYITLANKERVPAVLIGDDHWTDIAVVRLDMEELADRGVTFQYADLGDSKGLVPGQDVIAIGTPFGLARTITKGIVSNTERTFYPREQTIDGYETGRFNNWIQMDAPIAPGNSGGPLVDLNADVVGINTRGYTGQDLNFAIPINVVKRVRDEILDTVVYDEEGDVETKGKVTRGDLGVSLKPLRDLEAFYSIDANRGVLIDNVEKNSPADEAGLRVQDILLSIAGRETNVRFPEQLAAVMQFIANLPIGETVEMTVLRGGEEITVEATVDKLESQVGEERELRTWGLSVRDVTRTYANNRQLDDAQGVVVTTVRTGFPAEQAELNPGDVIKQINGQPAEDLEGFMSLYEQAVDAERERVLLTVARFRGTRSVLLKVEEFDR